MKTPKAPSELEIVRKTWNQFELVLADRGSAKITIQNTSCRINIHTIYSIESMIYDQLMNP